MRYKVSVLCSGGGGNLKFILDEESRNDYDVISVITDRACGAETIATNYKKNLTRIERRPGTDFYAKLIDAIPSKTQLIVLAGYMPILSSSFLEMADCPIVNTHPSLLPRYGGKGMYGVRVQQAVLEAGETVAGCTVHLVNEKVDGGPILSQRMISVPKGIDAWGLGNLVFKLEGPQLVDVINSFARMEPSDG